MRQTLDNVIFIGMPGSGKSTLGVLYAKAEMYAFCDTDLLIQQKERLPLFKIIEKKGIEGFSEIESEIVSGLHGYHRTVIATGGSVVLSGSAMENLRKNGVIVYIKLPCEEIKRRVRNITTRGLVMRSGETLEDVYRERVPLYEKYADVTVDCTGLRTEQSVEKIVKAIKEARKNT
ncbi:MAG: shikimate kinase [Ruminococcaceae bacterium]|nr:shikimate kinase [Oscillospiraceae bacterium]